MNTPKYPFKSDLGPGKKRDRKVTVRVQEAAHTLLQMEAVEERITMSALVRKLIGEAMELRAQKKGVSH